jgi:hypothetical protein
MVKLRRFWVFLATGTLLLPMGLGSLGAAQEEEQIEWRTYSDHEYNWSMDYPSSWWVVKPESYATLFIGDKGVSACVGFMGEDRGKEFLVSADLEGRFHFLQVFLKSRARSQYSMWFEVSEGTIQVGGEPAMEAVYIMGDSLPDTVERRVILVARGKALYGMVYTAPASLYSEMNEVYFEPMVQSMSFEEKEAIIEEEEVVLEKEEAIIEGPTLVGATWAEIPTYHSPSSDVHYVPSVGMKFIWVQVKLRAGAKPVETSQVDCYVEDQDGVRWNLGDDQNAYLAAYGYGLPTHAKNPSDIPPGETYVLYFEGQTGEKVIPENIGVDIQSTP